MSAHDALLPWLLLLAGSPGHDVPPAIHQDGWTGLYWGGLDRPGDFETVVLELREEEEAGLVAVVGRPYQGIGAQPMSVSASGSRLVLEREDDGRTVALDCTREGDLLLGEARIGEHRAPLALRRILDLAPGALDELVGDYRSESGERLRVERLPIATRHEVLACTWTSSLRERMLFPVERDGDALVCVYGPDFERAGPTRGTVRFEGGRSLVWRDVDGPEESAERFPIALDARRVDAYATEVLAASGAPGLSVGVVHGEELVLARSYGVADRESGRAATPDTPYQIASVTKVFTATLLCALRDEGVLGLDDRVARWLPPDAELPTGAEDVTLRQLVTHTSGLRLQPTNYVWNGRHNDDYTAELLLAGLPETSLLFAPGSSWSYSNLGFVLLGHALGRAGGASYEELLQRHVLQPLGMRASTITLDPETRASLATHYWSDDPLTPSPPWIPGEIAAQGGVTSTVRDLARFLSFSMRDERVHPGAGTARGLREVQAPHARRGDGSGWIGLGWFLDVTPGAGAILWHSGFTGGSSSYVAFSPALEVGVVVLTNFGVDPALSMGTWLLDEAAARARDQLVPSEHEARTWFAREDWPNAAWAYEVLAELAPGDASFRERAAEARAHLP